MEGIRMQFRSEGASKGFAASVVTALNGVSFDLADDEVVGLVGESGSGKSTIGQILLKLIRPTAGQVSFKGKALGDLSRTENNEYRQSVQAVFQDPRGSLSPRRTVSQTLHEPLRARMRMSNAERTAEISRVMAAVGLNLRLTSRLPHELSGGQAQRVAIARALIMRPKYLICDEPLSSLDMSIQAQILNLFTSLRQDLRLGILFISHDLTVVRYLADRVIVLYLGQVMEIGPASEVLKSPQHPYTAALISAEPMVGSRPQQRRRVLGTIERDPAASGGCRLRPRCWLHAELGHPPICAQAEPRLEASSAKRASACHFREKL
jgi:oligopeptide/dipeptide ABC transporter ATP-binding protein